MRLSVTALLALLGALVVGTSANPAASMPAVAEGAAALRATRTTISCRPETLVPHAPTACTVKVADTATGKKSPPAGTTSVASNAPGSFENATCTLAASAAAASTCAIAYEPDAIGNGIHVLTASYSGSDAHGPSAGRFDLAVSPPNDARRNAAVLRAPPSRIEGTTIGATTDYSDPEPGCAEPEATVWYALATRASGRIAIRLRARGRLDAVIGVFRRVRSQLQPVGCAPTDENGVGGIGFQAERGGRYLIVVGERDNSAASTFTLELFAPPLAHPPGQRIPSGGTRSSVDPLTRPEAAWSVALAAGRTYRINLVPDRGHCLSLYLFEPRASSFSATPPIREAECGGYLVFTPGAEQAGRYSLLVRAYGNRGGTQRYRLQVARAGRDDTSPGLLIRSGQTRRGTLSGRSIDVVDLYRFDVTHRTEVTGRLLAPRKANFDLVLLSGDGYELACVCRHSRQPQLRARLDEGDYFLAVRARGPSAGRYRVSLLIREITATLLTLGGADEATAELGQSVLISSVVTPSAAVGGLVRLQIERFDPIEGWQFVRRVGARVGPGGVASASWTPPSVGRWRIRAFFVGTEMAAPSASGVELLRVRD